MTAERQDGRRQEVKRQGVGVSAGIAFGRAYLIGRDSLKAPRHHVEPDDVDTEVARLYKAIAASDKQLAKIKEKLASENESDYHIITAHQMMLHDEHLVGAAVSHIRDDKINAEWALRRAVDEIRAVFDSIEDEYLRERRSDVEFVFERVLRNLLGRDTGPLTPPPDAIVVAHDLSPADTANFYRAAVAGLATDAGHIQLHEWPERQIPRGTPEADADLMKTPLRALASVKSRVPSSSVVLAPVGSLTTAFSARSGASRSTRSPAGIVRPTAPLLASPR